MRYELQINEWTTWTADRSFDTALSAKFYARERYIQNEWRIYDKVSQRIVHEHDPSETFRQIASSDLNRFQRVAEWTESNRNRQNQLLRAAELERRRNTTLSRLHQVASRRRTQFIPRQLDELLCTTKEEKVNWLKEGF